MVSVVKSLKTDFQRGREAAQGGVEICELYSLPSPAYLEAYFSERFVNRRLGLIMAAAVKYCSPRDSEEVVATIRDLPPTTRTAIYLALDTKTHNDRKNIAADAKFAARIREDVIAESVTAEDDGPHDAA